MRKSFARYTGVHGFFSMKYSDATPKNPDEEAAAELLRKRLELIQVHGVVQLMLGLDKARLVCWTEEQPILTRKSHQPWWSR